MDLNLYSEPDETPSFATDLAKTFVLSAVAVMGTFAGVVIVGGIAGWWKNRKDPKPLVKITKEDLKED